MPDVDIAPTISDAGASDAGACCAPLSAGPISKQEAAQLSALLKALSDPVRLRLMSLIASSPGEACFCDLNNLFDQSQPTISHHLKVLYDAGLIEREKRGVWVYYRPRPHVLASLATLFGPARPRQRRAHAGTAR